MSTTTEQPLVWVKTSSGEIRQGYICGKKAEYVIIEDWLFGLPMHYQVKECDILGSKLSNADAEQLLNDKRDYYLKIRTLEGTVQTLEKQIASLKVELLKTPQLKAQVGNIIYMPWEYNGQSDVARLKITEILITDNGVQYYTDFNSDDLNYCRKYNNGVFIGSDFGTVVFTDMREATIVARRWKFHAE